LWGQWYFNTDWIWNDWVWEPGLNGLYWFLDEGAQRCSILIGSGGGLAGVYDPVAREDLAYLYQLPHPDVHHYYMTDYQ